MPETINLKRKGFFGLMVWEVSAHGWVDPLLLGCGKTAYHGGEHTVKPVGSPHGSWEAKREEGARSYNPRSGYTPSDLTSSR